MGLLFFNQQFPTTYVVTNQYGTRDFSYYLVNSRMFIVALKHPPFYIYIINRLNIFPLCCILAGMPIIKFCKIVHQVSSRFLLVDNFCHKPRLHFKNSSLLCDTIGDKFSTVEVCILLLTAKMI